MASRSDERLHNPRSITRATDRGNVLTRRYSTNRHPQYVGVPNDGEVDLAVDMLSVTSSDQTDDNTLNSIEDLWYDLDDNQQRMKRFDEFANRTLMPEERDLMLKKFERAGDIPFERTYQLGKPVRSFPDSTAVPNVAIVLLQGGDLSVFLGVKGHFRKLIPFDIN